MCAGTVPETCRNAKGHVGGLNLIYIFNLYLYYLLFVFVRYPGTIFNPTLNADEKADSRQNYRINDKALLDLFMLFQT